MYRTALFCTLALTCLPAQAETYKCKTANGATLFQDHPCEGENRTTEIRSDGRVSPAERARMEEERRRINNAQLRTQDASREPERTTPQQPSSRSAPAVAAPKESGKTDSMPDDPRNKKQQ
jgi:hypothetical protein